MEKAKGKMEKAKGKMEKAKGETGEWLIIQSQCSLRVRFTSPEESTAFF